MATKKFKCNVCGYVHEANEAPEKCPVCGVAKSEFQEIVEENAAPKKKGLDTGSNVYTIVYAAVMVVIVAFLLVFVSSSLKDRQTANVINDTKQQILYSLNYEKLADVATEYDNVIKGDYLMTPDGSASEYDGEFQTSYSSEFKNGNYHVFVAEIEGKVKYVIPMNGQGLWGAIWGYVALNEDRNTIYGVYFSHASETPGLGAEIKENKSFQQSFQGKKVTDEGQVAINLVKFNTADKSSSYEVDGVSGATMTSNGVNKMMNDVLTAYLPFLSGAAHQCEHCANHGEGECAHEHAEGEECEHDHNAE